MTFTNSDLVRLDSGMDDNNFIQDENVDFFVDAADAEVMQAVGQHYVVPLDTANPTNWDGSPAQAILKLIATQIASCELTKQQFENAGGNYTDLASMKCKKARSKLKKIVMRELRLYGSDGSELAVIQATNRGVFGCPQNPKFAFKRNQVF
jgi:hypothetical protein